MLLHHALHWAVDETSQFMRLCYLSDMRPAKAQPDGPAHQPSLARGVTAHIYNEGACLKLGL